MLKLLLTLTCVILLLVSASILEFMTCGTGIYEVDYRLSILIAVVTVVPSLTHSLSAHWLLPGSPFLSPLSSVISLRAL